MYRLTLLLFFEIVSFNVIGKPYDVGDFVRYAEFHQAKISPGGDYLAVSRQIDRRIVLLVLSMEDMSQVGAISGERFDQIHKFFWANDKRLVMQMRQVSLADTSPRSYGHIYAANFDGSNAKILFGQMAGVGRFPGRVGPRPKVAFGRVIDKLAADPDYVLIAAEPPHGPRKRKSHPQKAKVYKLNIFTGSLTPGIRAPLARGELIADRDGRARLFSGMTEQFKPASYYREEARLKWELIAHGFDHVIKPVAFRANNENAYVLATGGPKGVYGLYEFDGRSKSVEPVYQPERVDLERDDFIFTPDGRAVGYEINVGGFSYRYIDKDDRLARWHRMLTAAFPRQRVSFTSFTDDMSLAIVRVSNDINPGDFFLFDTHSLQASYLLGRREWLDPNDMARVEPVIYTASDGTTIDAYVTRLGDNGPTPMVVMPHGGPHVRDYWAFDPRARLLANRGYTVLQMNFRGSSGYGVTFERAADKEWGELVQRDIADGVRWAIEEDIADPDRICIYGNSFGAYSAFMNVILYPELYRCAAALSGFYDFEVQLEESDTSESRIGRKYLETAFGDDKTLAREYSPINHVDKIDVPVFIAHGGKDRRTPVKQARRLRKLLRKEDIPHEWMYRANEGHGFYLQDNRIEFYTKLVDFLDDNIGGS